MKNVCSTHDHSHITAEFKLNAFVDGRGHISFKDQRLSAGEIHVLVVNCWLAVKETLLLIGVMTEQVPLYESKGVLAKV